MKRTATGTCTMNHKRDMGLYGHLEKLKIGIDRMAISKLMIMKTYLIKSKIHIVLESSLFTCETPCTFQKWPTADGFLGKYGIFWAKVSSSTALALTNIDFLFSSADQFCVSRANVIFFCVNGRFLQLKQTVEQPSIIVRASVNSLLFLSSVGQHWGTWNFLN